MPIDIGAVQRGPQGRWPRCLAALRLPGLQPGVLPPGRHGRRRPPRHAPVVLPDPGSPANPGRWCTPSSAHNLDHLPGTKTVYAGRDQLEAGLGNDRSSGVKRVAMEYSPRCAIPYVSRVDAGTIELVRVARRRRGVVRRSDPAVRGALERGGHRHAPHGIRESCIASRTRRSKQSRGACATGSPTTEYDIQQQMVGWFTDEGLVADSAPCVSAQENAGNPHYLATAAEHRVDSQERAGAARSVGQAAAARRGVRRHHLDRVRRAPTIPDAMAKAFAAICGARDAAVDVVQDAAAGGARSARLRSRPRGAQGPASTPATGTPSCTAPATAWAKTSTATAPIWTITKLTTSGGCCPAAALPSNLGCISRILASGPRSTWSGPASGPEVTGPASEGYLLSRSGVGSQTRVVGGSQCRVGKRRCSIRC